MVTGVLAPFNIGNKNIIADSFEWVHTIDRRCGVFVNRHIIVPYSPSSRPFVIAGEEAYANKFPQLSRSRVRQSIAKLKYPTEVVMIDEAASIISRPRIMSRGKKRAIVDNMIKAMKLPISGLDNSWGRQRAVDVHAALIAEMGPPMGTIHAVDLAGKLSYKIILSDGEVFTCDAQGNFAFTPTAKLSATHPLAKMLRYDWTTAFWSTGSASIGNDVFAQLTGFMPEHPSGPIAGYVWPRTTDVQFITIPVWACGNAYGGKPAVIGSVGANSSQPSGVAAVVSESDGDLPNFVWFSSPCVVRVVQSSGASNVLGAISDIETIDTTTIAALSNNANYWMAGSTPNTGDHLTAFSLAAYKDHRSHASLMSSTAAPEVLGKAYTAMEFASSRAELDYPVPAKARPYGYDLTRTSIGGISINGVSIASPVVDGKLRNSVVVSDRMSGEVRVSVLADALELNDQVTSGVPPSELTKLLSALRGSSSSVIIRLFDRAEKIPLDPLFRTNTADLASESGMDIREEEMVPPSGAEAGLTFGEVNKRTNLRIKDGVSWYTSVGAVSAITAERAFGAVRSMYFKYVAASDTLSVVIAGVEKQILEDAGVETSSAKYTAVEVYDATMNGAAWSFDATIPGATASDKGTWLARRLFSRESRSDLVTRPVSNVQERGSEWSVSDFSDATYCPRPTEIPAASVMMLLGLENQSLSRLALNLMHSYATRGLAIPSAEQKAAWEYNRT